MLLLDVPGSVLATALLVVPGAIWAWRRYPAAEGATRLSVGLALGVVAQMHASALLAATVGITRWSVLASAIVLGAAGVALALWLPVGARGAVRVERRRALHVAGIVAAITLPRLVPLVAQRVPPGWDPSFHVLLASTTVATGHLPTWQPYEQIVSNYPYGSHVLVAEASLLTGIAPHAVFAALLNGPLPAVTGLALYALARRMWHRHDVALAAVAAYGLLGNWGSVDYGRWGGLPNALGFWLLLVVALVLFAPGCTRTRAVVGGLVLSGVPLAHHHVLLVAVLLLGAYAAWLGMRWVRGPQAVRRASWRRLTRLALTGLVAAVAVAYYAVPLALRAGRLGGTRVLAFVEEVPGLPLVYNGVLLWALALGWLVFWARHRPRWARTREWGSAGQAHAFALVAGAALFLAFVVGYYGFRTYSLIVHEQPYTAFTPSRFLTDATYLIALYAAPALALLWQRAGRLGAAHLPRLPRWLASRRGAQVARAALVAVLAANVLAYLPGQMFGEGLLAPGEARAFAWVRAQTEATALVLNDTANRRWAPYFTAREVAFTPVPTSEFTQGRVAEKRALATLLLDVLRSPPTTRVLSTLSTGGELAALAQRPVVLLTQAPPAALQGDQPAYQAGGVRVYRLGQAFARLLPPGAAWQQATAGSARTYTLRLAGPLPPEARLGCAAEGAASVRVDGAPDAVPCGRGLEMAAALARPGPHTVVVEAAPGTGWVLAAVVVP